MSSLISDYGAGTGISNFDVQNVMQRVGADPTAFEETIVDILGRMESIAAHILKKHSTVINAMKNADGVDPALVDAFQITPFSARDAASSTGTNRQEELRKKYLGG